MTQKELLIPFKKSGIPFFKDIGNFRYCPTGEKYQSIASDGVKEHSLDDIKTYKSKKEAVGVWIETVHKIINNVDKNAIVFWRKKPALQYCEKSSYPLEDQQPHSSGWRVYSRFKISSLPIIQDADYKKRSQA